MNAIMEFNIGYALMVDYTYTHANARTHARTRARANRRPR